MFLCGPRLYCQGVDDVLALLLAFAAAPEDLEVLLVSLTYGNVDVPNCLRNTVSLFHHIEQEITWRREQGQPGGFESLQHTKPLVAVGAEGPLADQMMMADYFRMCEAAHVKCFLAHISRWA